MADVSNSKLLQVNTGMLNLQDACIVIIKTEWNAAIVDELETGCLRILNSQPISHIKSLVVPGAFEIPFAIKRYYEHATNLASLSTGMKPDAFIALGAVVQGDTPHFDYVCRAITDGVLQLNLTLDVPVIFGVLTVNNEQQALERIGGKHGHKGEEAALTALKMISLVKSFAG